MLLFRAVAITLATYPHLAEREGKRRQIFAFKPMNPIAHKRIEQAVLSAYKEELRKAGSTSGF